MSASSPFESGSEEISRTCQILILCEDFAAYERAAECCWRVVMQLADDLDFSFNCWNFYELSDPACTHSVIRAAKASDVILLSLHQPVLSSVAEEWLDIFASHRQRAEGVLALVLNEPSGSPLVVARLAARVEQYAKKLGMDFLSLAATPSEIDIGDLMSATVPRGTYGERISDHWGLNE